VIKSNAALAVLRNDEQLTMAIILSGAAWLFYRTNLIKKVKEAPLKEPVVQR
jgi:hypothetical protein